MSPEHHSIDYIEIPVKDLSLSKEFYSQAFGWRFQDYHPTYAGFLLSEKGREMGGLAVVENLEDFNSSPGKAAVPLVILFSTDLEASLESVKNAGGDIVEAIFSFPGGRRFHFKDPNGHTLAVWSET